MDLVRGNPRGARRSRLPERTAPACRGRESRGGRSQPGGCRMIRRVILAAALGVALGGPACAVEPSERLADPALEARARSLSQELRCLVCQNQSIDESNADLAHALRVLLRKR